MITSDELLRPALELAVTFARAGIGLDPPVDPPRALRPILGFARLPTSALAVVRRALEQDEEFRTRVAAEASAQEDTLGRAGWLFLTRPQGWEDEVGRLQAAEAEASAAGAGARQERSAQRRLRGAEEATRRAEEQLGRVRSELASAQRLLAEERQVRRQAEVEREALQRRVVSLERERDAAHRRATAATNEVTRLNQELRDQLRRLAALEAEPPAPKGPTPAEEPPVSGVVPTASVEGVRLAVEEAASAAGHLAAALGAAARALQPPAGGDDDAPATAGDAEPSLVRAARAPTKVRLPVVLPPGLLGDSREAADFLVRVPGLLLVVDGYNASLRRWPDLPIGVQRQRLVDALAGLSARSGCEVHVVFDGAGELSRAPAVPRRQVRVTFSPAAVEADEVIVELVDQAPPQRPVAVATDDRRVQRQVGALGANAISQAQLFAVAGIEG